MTEQPTTEQPYTEMGHIEAGPPHPVAARDGRGGCPERDWLDYLPVRCGFGITECHKHGKFETRPPVPINEESTERGVDHA